MKLLLGCFATAIDETAVLAGVPWVSSIACH